MSYALKFLKTHQWAILREHLELIGDIAQRADDETIRAKLDAIQREPGERLPGTEGVQVRDGVATVPLVGPIFRRANIFTEISGATSTEIAAQEFSRAVEDDQVRAIVLHINSPGGQVDGTSELAQMIFRARGRKPIRSFVSGLGASAAFWIATAADEVIAGDTAELGSVGIVLSVQDFSERDEKRGVKTMEIVSSRAPLKRIDPFSDDEEEAAAARQVLQERVDALEDVFIGSVARNLGVDEATVVEDFGRGNLLVGDAAVEAGMASRIGTLEEVIEELSTSRSTRPSTRGARTMDADEITTVADLKEAFPQLTSRIEDEARASGVKKGVESGRVQERDRITSILALPAKGFEQLRDECVADPEATPGDAAQRILNAQSEAESARKKAHADALDADEGKLSDVKPAPAPDADADESSERVERLKAARKRASRSGGSTRVAT